MGVKNDIKSRFSPKALFQHNGGLYRTIGTTPDGNPIVAGGAEQVDAQQKAFQQQQAQQTAASASQRGTTGKTYTYPGEEVVNNVVQKIGQEKAASPVTNYTGLLRELVPQEDPEQIAKQNRRERAKKNIAALSDTISAIANLGSTMAGAPNAVDPRQSLSAVSQARWDEIKKEREKNRELYLTSMLKAAQLDEARQQQRQNAADLKAYREQQLEDNRLYHDALIRNAEARQQAINENNQANNAIRQQNANSNSKRADAAYNNSLKKGSSGGRRSSGNESKKVVVENEYNSDGKVVKKTTTTSRGGRGNNSSQTEKKKTRVQV
jgi:hypothetical protein